MLKLIDLISLSGTELTDFKIHCATGSDWLPLDAYFEGRFQEWQEYQNQRNFECEKIVSLIHLRGTEWLFAGVWTVLGSKPRQSKGDKWFEYSLSEDGGMEHLVGRAIVHFDKTFRASYLRGPKYIDQLAVAEIRPTKMSIGDFPGYSDVRISFERLQLVIRQDIDSWRSALSSVSGVYVIADTSNGKQYIGSAYGVGGIWGRWSQYVHTGHGNNKELRRLLKAKGKDYSENFQFTILEICDPQTAKEQLISREVHWKNCLLTKQFGYNEN